jgi:predicted methyltransferase
MRTILGTLVAAVSLIACSSAPPPEPMPPPAPEPAMPAPPPAPVEAPPPEPTAEEKKKAQEAKELQEDRLKMEAANQREMARLTPEIRAEVKALTEKAFPSGKAAITAAMAGKHRAAGNADRDKHRHPAETLDFWGYKTNMTVFEYGPGEGWFTELLAPTLAKSGQLIINNGDANGPADQRSTFYAQRTKLFLERLPEAYGKVKVVVTDSKAPDMKTENAVDMVIIARGLHGMKNNGNLSLWLDQAHKMLKPNGVLAIEQHRAAPDANVDEASKKGYLPEKWVIEQIEGAGFKLAKKSEINANPKDTRDYPNGVWSLPPSLDGGEKDREKYVAIGESDRMTLKFTKVAKKAAPAPKADAAAPAKADPAAKSGTPAPTKVDAAAPKADPAGAKPPAPAPAPPKK